MDTSVKLGVIIQNNAPSVISLFLRRSLSVVMNNLFSAVLTRQISPVKSNVRKPSHVVTFAKIYVETYVQNVVWLNAGKLFHANMKNACPVLKIPWFIVSATETAQKSWTVAILAQKDVRNPVNVTPKLKLSYSAGIVNGLYVASKTHSCVLRDARVYWTVDTFALVFVTKTVECNNAKSPSAKIFHAATNKLFRATLTHKMLFASHHAKANWNVDTRAHPYAAIYATRFTVKKCVKRGASGVMRASDSATLVCPVVTA